MEIWGRHLHLGEKLEREDVDVIMKECCDAEDADGFIPYERKCEPGLL